MFHAPKNGYTNLYKCGSLLASPGPPSSSRRRSDINQTRSINSRRRILHLFTAQGSHVAVAWCMLSAARYVLTRPSYHPRGQKARRQPTRTSWKSMVLKSEGLAKAWRSSQIGRAWKTRAGTQLAAVTTAYSGIERNPRQSFCYACTIHPTGQKNQHSNAEHTEWKDFA